VIRFNIRPALLWNPETDELGHEAGRYADLYVFCVLNHKDKSTVDPMDLDQWDFYVLRSSLLNPAQKTIVLSSLLKLKPSPCKANYWTLAECVTRMATEGEPR